MNIADEVRCAICYDTMVYAHTTQCSHSFCGMCIFDCLIKVHAPRPRPTMIPHGGCDARQSGAKAGSGAMLDSGWRAARGEGLRL